MSALWGLPGSFRPSGAWKAALSLEGEEQEASAAPLPRGEKVQILPQHLDQNQQRKWGFPAPIPPSRKSPPLLGGG